MIINQRFSLNEDDRIIDKLNPANNQKAEWFEDLGYPKSEECFRELLLWRRLGELLPNLVIDTDPMKKYPNGEHSICIALHNAIIASQLNVLDVALSVQHKFNGKLKREKRGMEDFTSLSLFVDDVERLLRDLYGESDCKAIDSVQRAIFVIVSEFARYLCKDLWQEHQDAKDFDYVFGIGLPDGYGLSGSDHRRMHRAAHALALRGRAVRTNPAAFSKYTIEFVKVLDEEWPSLDQRAESGERSMRSMPTEEIPK